MLSRSDFLDALSAQVARFDEGTNVAVLLARVQRLGETNLMLSDIEAGAARERIEQALRAEDRVAQIGECDFAIALPAIRGSNHACLAANRLVRSFKEPLVIDGRPLQTTVAVGVAVGPDHGLTAEALCRNAEKAYADAIDSADGYAVYSPEAQRLEIPYVDLQEALVNNRLAVHLQGVWDLRTGRLAAAESLARWDSPRLGRIGPDVFVPLAEQNGLIAQLTRWSINVTMRHAGELRDMGLHLPIAINLSARVFHLQGIVEQILGALELWNIAPTAVVMEVSENAMMADPRVSARVLTRLHDNGLRISIDDFGSGHSSFAYLKQFPATELKIDKSFVLDMARDERAMRLVRSMIDLAHNLDIVAIAEGVEDQRTADLLAAIDCDFAQGHLFGRPKPADEFIAELRANP